jgi:hypothetical protein
VTLKNVREVYHTITGVDSVVVVLEEVIENVAVAKAEGGRARVEVGPIVVGKSDGDGHVLRTIAVRVADKTRLPVVVELAVGYSDSGAAMSDIQEAIVAIYYRVC